LHGKTIWHGLCVIYILFHYTFDRAFHMDFKCTFVLPHNQSSLIFSPHMYNTYNCSIFLPNNNTKFKKKNLEALQDLIKGSWHVCCPSLSRKYYMTMQSSFGPTFLRTFPTWTFVNLEGMANSLMEPIGSFHLN